MKITKRQLAFIIPLFLIGIVAAAYIVSTLTLTVGVKEAFEVEYAILGDGQNDYTGESCLTAEYNSAENIEAAMESFGTEGDTILPGQKRFICARITNYAGELPYTMTASIVGGNGKCLTAFGGPYEVTGTTVTDSGTEPGINYDGFEVVVAEDAPIITGCIATINVARG